MSSCYPDGRVIQNGETIDGWCGQCGHLKLAHHVSGQCAACQIIAQAAPIYHAPTHGTGICPRCGVTIATDPRGTWVTGDESKWNCSAALATPERTPN